MSTTNPSEMESQNEAGKERGRSDGRTDGPFELIGADRRPLDDAIVGRHMSDTRACLLDWIGNSSGRMLPDRKERREANALLHAAWLILPHLGVVC